MNNITIGLEGKGCKGLYWTRLAQEWAKLHTFLKKIMKLRDP